MDEVKLMNRIDSKFVFSFESMQHILDLMLPYYDVLEVEHSRLNRYESLYFDTSDLLLYRRHLAGKLNRYKIRYRTYVESQLSFLEIKFKNNKGRTIKERIKQSKMPALNEAPVSDFIKSHSPLSAEKLKPCIWINFQRMTFVDKQRKERLTIDVNLEFIKGDKKKNMNQMVVAELKQAGKQYSPFSHMMKTMHIREGSLSKYCMGIAFCEPEAKSNNFKPQLLKIKHFI